MGHALVERAHCAGGFPGLTGVPENSTPTGLDLAVLSGLRSSGFSGLSPLIFCLPSSFFHGLLEVGQAAPTGALAHAGDPVS